MTGASACSEEMTNKITEKDIARAAEKLIDFLNKNATFIYLNVPAEQNILLDKKTKERIISQSRPSNIGTTAYTMSYIMPGRCIALELKINKELGYSKIITKGDFNLEDYNQFTSDAFNNIIQSKEIKTTDIFYLKSELEKLIKF